MHVWVEGVISVLFPCVTCVMIREMWCVALSHSTSTVYLYTRLYITTTKDGNTTAVLSLLPSVEQTGHEASLYLTPFLEDTVLAIENTLFRAIFFE